LFNAGSSCVISIIRSWRPGENRRLGLIGIEAARFRRLPLAQQNAEHVHRRAQQRLAVQRRAVARHDGRRVETINEERMAMRFLGRAAMGSGFRFGAPRSRGSMFNTRTRNPESRTRADLQSVAVVRR